MDEKRLWTLSQYVREHARKAAGQISPKAAVVVDDQSLTYGQLDAAADGIARGLHRQGVGPGSVVAIVGGNSLGCVSVMVGIARVGAIAAPLPTSADSSVLAAMLRDSGAAFCFADDPENEAIQGVLSLPLSLEALQAWSPFGGEPYQDEPADETEASTIIYSSGTTGTPKGIVQSNLYRSRLLAGGSTKSSSETDVAILGTPLYSNTTLASFLPTLGAGGTVVLMAKFDADKWMELVERHRVTRAMMVPVMIDRILAHPDFDSRDLSSLKLKYCTSAPFSAAAKKTTLDRWPGGLIEFYGMTEGGATLVLPVHDFPDKLHTVGRPAPGSEIRLLGEDDLEVPQGQAGEIVGRSEAMMLGYHNRPGDTAACRWTAPDGSVWQRTGDIGRIDEDGFLIIVDRKKDMIISGGFNIYPADIEAVLETHPLTQEAAVIGVPDSRWGETPVVFAVMNGDPEDLKTWVNERVGKMQRVADVVLVDTLPRGPIGKVLKRELRDLYLARSPRG